MNLIKLAHLFHDENQVIRVYQRFGILHKERKCPQGHEMKLYERKGNCPRWRCHRSKCRNNVFILLWVFLQNAVVSFGGNLLSIYYQKSDLRHDDLPYYWSPNYWIGGGGIAGGILILVLSQSLDIKSHFCTVRYIQILGIGLVCTFYKIQNYEWAQEYWTYGLCSTFFLQGAADCMSQILTPVYVMNTICDRDLNEPVAFLLLVTTQLPIYLASCFAQLLAINPLFMTVGVGVFGGIFFIVFAFSIFLPKSTQEGKQTDRSEYIEYWHLQSEEASGWLRPGLTVTALYLLAQLSGLRLYQFYSFWTLRLSQIPLQPGLLDAAVSLASILVALLAWTKEKLPYFLVVTTGLLVVCSFLSGVVVHGLESGGRVYAYLPVCLQILFTGAHAVGLGSLPPVVGALVTPRAHRLAVLGVATTLSAGLDGLSRAAVPALLQLLHPFRVFWLHSAFLLIGLLHIALSVLPQLRDRNYPPDPPHTPLQEFVTQV